MEEETQPKVKEKFKYLGMTKFELIVYFIAFVLPILSMIACPGWNEAHGVTKCLVNCDFIKEFAGLIYMFILISAFLGLLPMLLYIALILAITEKLNIFKYILKGYLFLIVFIIGFGMLSSMISRLI